MLSIAYTYADGRAYAVSIAESASAKEQTVAIQKALTAVTANGGGAVTLSAGEWTVAGTGKASDGCLKIGSKTTLEGAGQGTTVLKLADGSSAVTGILRTDSGKTKADGTFTVVDSVTVKNLTLDGNAARTTGDVDGFYCGPKPGTSQADTNITLDGVEIKNCSRYGFDPHEQTVGLTIRNSAAHHNGVDGFTIDFCSNVTLLNKVAYANGRHGFNIVTGSHDVTMIGNDAFDNGGSGISIQTGDNEIRGWTDRIHISGGSLTDNGRGGIEIKQASHIDIDGVIITGNGMDGVMLSGVQHVALSGNTLSGNGGTVRIDGYLQDFNDSDALNDRWVTTHNVRIDGVLQADPPVPSSVTVWDYTVTTGDDLIVTSSGRDVVAAGRGQDTVHGGAGADIVYGNDGRDTLHGDGNADTVDGGAGADIVFGDAGNDWLIGGAGSDWLTGGTGSDTFLFSLNSGNDTIADFTDRQDKIAISGVSNMSQLAIRQIGVDTDIGFGTAHVLLLGVNASTITATDFILQ
jgi:Right handed beta helix region/RTX calcium-binding nonapeptide repeat (4 copies)